MSERGEGVGFFLWGRSARLTKATEKQVDGKSGKTYVAPQNQVVRHRDDARECNLPASLAAGRVREVDRLAIAQKPAR